MYIQKKIDNKLRYSKFLIYTGNAPVVNSMSNVGSISATLSSPVLVPPRGMSVGS